MAASCHLTFVLSPKQAGSVNSPRCDRGLGTPAPSLPVCAALGLLGALTRRCSWMACLPVTLSRTCRTACTCLTSVPSSQPAQPRQPGCPAVCNPHPSATSSASRLCHVRVWLVWVDGDVAKRLERAFCLFHPVVLRRWMVPTGGRVAVRPSRLGGSC